MTIRGDVVEYTGTDRPLTLTNGYGDWNESFRDWKAGSALWGKMVSARREGELFPTK